MHAIYIVIVLIGFGAISLLFPEDLLGRSALGIFLSGFLAVFWLLRVGIQICCYDREVKRQNPVANAIFTAAFLYLGLVFLAAVIFRS